MHLGIESDGEALAAFYAQRARGGAGLIVTGGSSVSRVGAGGRNYSFINDPAGAAPLRDAAAAVHDAGGRIALQLFHAGRYAFYSHVCLAAGCAVRAALAVFARSAPRARGNGDSRHDSRFCERCDTRERARLRRRRGDGFGGIPAQSVPIAPNESARRRVGRRLRAAHELSARGAARDPRECRRRIPRDFSHLRRRLDAELNDARTKRSPSLGRSLPMASTRSTWA